MKISTKGQYGLEAMLDLAVNASEGPVSLKSISLRQNLPENYLEQIFLKLRRSKLVESVRGAQGGYRLARPAEEINVLEVLNALEGPLTPVTCAAANNGKACERYATCVSRTLWEKITKILESTTAPITLGKLVEQYRKSGWDDGSIEYYI